MDIDHDEEEDEESILSVSIDFITSTALMNAPLKITANISTTNSTVGFDKFSAEHLGYAPVLGLPHSFHNFVSQGSISH